MVTPVSSLLHQATSLTNVPTSSPWNSLYDACWGWWDAHQRPVISIPPAQDRRPGHARDNIAASLAWSLGRRRHGGCHHSGDRQPGRSAMPHHHPSLHAMLHPILIPCISTVSYTEYERRASTQCSTRHVRREFVPQTTHRKSLHLCDASGQITRRAITKAVTLKKPNNCPALQLLILGCCFSRLLLSTIGT